MIPLRKIKNKVFKKKKRAELKTDYSLSLRLEFICRLAFLKKKRILQRRVCLCVCPGFNVELKLKLSPITSLFSEIVIDGQDSLPANNKTNLFPSQL